MFCLRLSNYCFPIQLFGILTMLAADFLSSNAAAAGSLKYTHGPLASALNGRSHEYGTPASSSSGGGSGSAGGGKSDSVEEGSGEDDDDGEDVNGVAVSGGEILVPKAFPMSAQEPTCEQLRAMWIFSKRQSRAAEITNEIPTYRDPFAYNVWEPYYSTTRSLGAMRMVPRYSERLRSPVFGRVISREPLVPQRMSIGHQLHVAKAAVGPARNYGETKPTSSLSSAGAVRRHPIKYRYMGANSGGVSGSLNSVGGAQGSFQKLKELIWTERAKELTQQRRVEEMAARAAVLKEIAKGQNVHYASSYKHPYKSESLLMDENRSPNPDSFTNDGRISIASGQQQMPLVNNNKPPYFKSSPRSYPNKAGSSHHGVHKTSIFSGNIASNSGRSARPLLPGMIPSSNPVDEARERERSSIGIPKIYPVRPSLFRERNRSLFKQQQDASSSDYFQRNLRNSASVEANRKKLLFELIMQNLNTQYSLRKYNKIDEVKVPSTRSFDNDDEEDEDSTSSANSDNLLIGVYDLDADAYGDNNNNNNNGIGYNMHPFMNTKSINNDEDIEDMGDKKYSTSGSKFSSYLPVSVLDLEQQLATDLLDYSNYYY